MRARLATPGERTLSVQKPPSTTKSPESSTKLALQPTASVDGAKLSLPAPSKPPAPALNRPLQLTAEEAPAAFLEMGYPKEAWSVLTKVLYPQATNLSSVLVAAQYCKAKGLDPLLKPIYVVPLKGGDAIWPGITLYRIQAHRTGEYMGITLPTWGPVVKTKWGIEMPEWVQITVYRWNKGEKVAYPAELWAEEQAVTDKDGNINEMWQESPRQQMKKGIEALALRMAFPEETGGEQTGEEMLGRADATGIRVETFEPPPPPPTQEERNETLLTIIASKIEVQEEVPKQETGQPAQSALQPSDTSTTEANATPPKPATVPAPALRPNKDQKSSGNQSSTTVPKQDASAANTGEGTSATQSENTTANQSADATTGTGASATSAETTQDTGTSASATDVELVPEVTEAQFEQLFAAAASNGWSEDQVIDRLTQFNTEPMMITLQQWTEMMDLVLVVKPGA